MSVERNFEKVISKEILSAANGQDGGPIYLAMYVANQGKICVFDVSSRADMYGPGCGYSVLVGRDASRALATMSLSEQGCDISDLNESQLKVLADWGAKFWDKYPIVGVLEN